MDQNANNDNQNNRFSKIPQITKLLITIGAVTIGITNLVIFPIVDAIIPSAHLVSNVAPILQGFIQAIIRP